MPKSEIDFISSLHSINMITRIFASLAADKSQAVPYDRDIADNRRKYGDGMLRKAEEHLANQRKYEAETLARLESARQRRREDKERQEAIEVRTCLPSI